MTSNKYCTKASSQNGSSENYSIVMTELKVNNDAYFEVRAQYINESFSVDKYISEGPAIRFINILV